VINNGIDIDVFVPSNKLSLRQELNLPIDQFLVLFVAEFSTNNPFKGGEIVREIIGNNINKEICFLTIGSENKKMDRKHIEIPYISKDEELAKLYAACDVLFYPTNADNFPLVVLEAMGCGLPVIASAIAGIPEIIKDNYNGFLVEGYSGVTKYQDKLDYVYGLNKSEKLIQISQRARQTVENQFSLKQMLDNYLLLYQSLMKDGIK
jgi:glycosyltransferase involved in cell wall biosynthesis